MRCSKATATSPPDCPVAVRAVVVAAHAEAVAFQVADRDLEGLGPSFGQQPPHLGAAGGGQQRHALGRGEAVVEGLHPGIHPLAAMLPGASEGVAVQLARVGAEDLAAEALDRLDLDPLSATQPAGRLHRAHVALERLGPGQLLQLLHPLLGGASLQGCQQGAGGQLGPRIGPEKRRTALLPGGQVQALEHRPHLLSAGLTVQAGRGGGAAHEPPR
jgi:hypothetical protein